MWQAGALGRDNSDTLNLTVWSIITQAMGLMACEEHRQIQWKDLQTNPVNAKEFLELIQEWSAKVMSSVLFDYILVLYHICFTRCLINANICSH